MDIQASACVGVAVPCRVCVQLPKVFSRFFPLILLVMVEMVWVTFVRLLVLVRTVL